MSISVKKIDRTLHSQSTPDPAAKYRRETRCKDRSFCRTIICTSCTYSTYMLCTYIFGADAKHYASTYLCTCGATNSASESVLLIIRTYKQYAYRHTVHTWYDADADDR
jgi:hypothetical protein